MRPCHGSRTDCVVCKYSVLGIDTWYCKLHDKYYRERNTKNGRITVAMHTCNGFERGMNRCDECYHMKPIRGGGGCRECKLHLNTPIRYEGKKCYEFLPKESESKSCKSCKNCSNVRYAYQTKEPYCIERGVYVNEKTTTCGKFNSLDMITAPKESEDEE